MRRAKHCERLWVASAVIGLAACSMDGREPVAGDEDVGRAESPITEPGAASTRGAVAVIAKLSGREFLSYCTGVLLDFNAAGLTFDDREAGRVPYWVLTAAHCIGLANGQADTYQAVLPNVCINDDDEPVPCDATHTTKFAFTFRTNDCSFSSADLRSGLTADASRKGDAALCKLTICNVDPYKTFAWQMPRLVRDRVAAARTVTVHGQRNARGFIPAFRGYPGWEPDPKRRADNTDDQGTLIWPSNRRASQTRGLVWSVAKELRTQAEGYDFDLSKGTLDHGDSGGPALIAEGAQVVSTNHTTSRKIYTGVTEATAADCRTERDKAEENRNANRVAACQRTTRIVDSHVTLIWEAMGQDIVAGRNDYWLDADEERAGSGFVGPASLRSVLVTDEDGPPVFADAFRSANEICVGPPPPLDEVDDPPPDGGPGDAGPGGPRDAGAGGDEDAGAGGGDQDAGGGDDDGGGGAEDAGAGGGGDDDGGGAEDAGADGGDEDDGGAGDDDDGGGGDDDGDGADDDDGGGGDDDGDGRVEDAGAGGGDGDDGGGGVEDAGAGGGYEDAGGGGGIVDAGAGGGREDAGAGEGPDAGVGGGRDAGAGGPDDPGPGDGCFARSDWTGWAMMGFAMCLGGGRRRRPRRRGERGIDDSGAGAGESGTDDGGHDGCASDGRDEDGGDRSVSVG